MSYVRISTLEKVEAVDIMLAHPDVSFPNRGWDDDDLAPFGYAELHYPSEHPFPDIYEKLVETTPQKIDGKWYIQFAVVPMTEEEIQFKKRRIKNDMILDIQNRLNFFAQMRGYDSILSLCTYATSTIESFRVEGQYGVQLRDAMWTKVYEILEEVETGLRPMPERYEDIESELPALVWPVE